MFPIHLKMDKRLQWADKITLERIEKMHPNLRDELREQYLQINTALPQGIRLRFTNTHRSISDQDYLYGQGRSRPGNKVTNAKGGQSIHNYGMAFDIVILVQRQGVWMASWTVDAHWIRVANFFKSRGWVWGGDWKSFVDNPHFEKTFGNTWQSLQAKTKKKDSNGIDYPII